MTDQSSYRNAQFVDDSPAAEDEFRGKPHQGVADTLVSILSSGEGGRAIGLEGPWGSGKSTVIDIAHTKLKALDAVGPTTKRHTFFLFDAWAHQGDPLRRVFLQELILSLEASEAVTKSYWNDQLEKLETRRKRVIETRAEKLSWVAKSSLIVVPLLPIAYALLSRTGGGGIALDWSSLGYPIIPYWTIALPILTAPFLVAAATWVSWRNGYGNTWKLLSSEWWRPRPDREGKSVIWAFTRQTDHVTTEQFIREEEATTVEFNRIFDKLIDDANEHNHRVVVVFDNLDRLASELIQPAWATMRNFFAAAPGSGRHSTLRNVWLIVPFDRGHIEATFLKEFQSEQSDAAPGFIEKTFEIVLRIAPPILSNWREFLARKLKLAFPDLISEEEIYQIFKIYEIYNRIYSRSITPRSIKSFVNAVVAQAKQWERRIPLEHQALYALYRSKIAKDISKLQDSSILDEPIRMQVADADWAKSLAAAHYNVDPSEALELLLTSEIAKAVSENNSDRLQKLQETLGFSTLLDRYISMNAQEWATKNPTALFDAAGTLSSFGILDTAALGEIWRIFRARIDSIGTSPNISKRTLDGVSAILKNSPARSQLKTAGGLLRVLSLAFSQEHEKPKLSGQAWYEVFESLFLSLDSSIPDTNKNEVFSGIAIPKNFGIIFEIAATAAKRGKLRFTAFQLQTSQNEISDALIAQIAIASPPPLFDEAIYTFENEASSSIVWPQIAAAIQARLRATEPALTSKDAQRLLSILADVEKKKLAPSSIKPLNDDGTLHSLIALAKTDTNLGLVGVALSEIIRFRAGALAGPEAHAARGSLAAVNAYLTDLQESPSDAALIGDLAKRAIAANRFSEIVRAALPADATRELCRAIFKRGVEIGTYHDLDPALVLSKMARIAGVLGPDLTKTFLEKFDSWNIDTHIDGEKWKSIDRDFLKLAAPLSTKHYTAALRAVHVGFESASLDLWKQALSANDNVARLLFATLQLELPPELGPSFYDAVKNISEAILEGAPPSPNASMFPALMPLMSAARLTQFSKWLRDRIIDKSPPAKLIVGALRQLGEIGMVEASLASRGEDVVRAIIDPILADGDSHGIQFLVDFGQIFAEAIDAAPRSNREELSQRLETLLASQSEDRKAYIEALGSALRISVNRVTEDLSDQPRDSDTDQGQASDPTLKP